MDSKVKFLRGTATEYEAKTKDNDTFYYTTDTKKLYLGETEIGNKDADTVDGKHADEFYPAQAAVIEGGDYDTLVNNGIYEIHGSATTPSTNAPNGNNISSNFYVQVFRHSMNWLTQIATSVRGDRKQYIRSKENGVWNAWKRISAGNADTVNNQNVEMSIYTSTSSFGVSNTDTADTIWKALPGNSIFAIIAQSLTDPSWNFPEDTSMHSLLMIKLSNMRPLGMYLYPKTNGSVYFANVDGNGAYLGNWGKLCDGGNAATANTAGTLATTASNVCLRNMSSGTDEANDTNCPVGAWYGQYE